MATLFYSTNGGLWANTANWLTIEPVCTWFGVQCAVVVGSRRLESGLITAVNLTRSLLENATELGLLSSDSTLDLSSNLIVGQLPSETTLLAKLKTLDLSTVDLWAPSFPDWRNEKYRGSTSTTISVGQFHSKLAFGQ
jgi:hypothetical protein